MKTKRFANRLTAAVAILSVTLPVAAAQAATQEKVMHSINDNDSDGANPFPNLILDAEGNLYGTTSQSGSNDYGTVFEIEPNGYEIVLITSMQTAPTGLIPMPD